MGGILKVSSLTQDHSEVGQNIAFHENVHHNKIRKNGPSSGTATRSRGTSWKYHLAFG
jgi:hypothetical protein